MKDEIIYHILKLIMNLLGLIPRRVGKFLGDVLGLIWFKIDKRHREITLENISLSLGTKSNAENRLTKIDELILAKKVFKNIAGMLFELGWAYRLKKEDLPKYFTLKGVEHLKKAHEKGKGVLFLLAHIGNWELLVASIALTGYKSSAIYRKLDFAPLERLILEMRQKYGTVMIPLRGASKQIDKLLANQEIVGTLIDQGVDWYKGVFVDFFGRPACTNSGVASLVLKTDAPVLPAYIIRDGYINHIMHFEPEITLVRTGDRIKDIEINTQNYTSAVESLIRQHPDQWFWVHNRWKVKNYSLLNHAQHAK
ncbi:MAG: lysophospholipid acyltransferase family protein [Desulfamplus sp.]|nr:lysophospholipid acyltransferase family protein [Desulfamplus sp.]